MNTRLQGLLHKSWLISQIMGSCGRAFTEQSNPDYAVKGAAE